MSSNKLSVTKPSTKEGGSKPRGKSKPPKTNKDAPKNAKSDKPKESKESKAEKA